MTNPTTATTSVSQVIFSSLLISLKSKSESEAIYLIWHPVFLCLLSSPALILELISATGNFFSCEVRIQLLNISKRTPGDVLITSAGRGFDPGKQDMRVEGLSQL